MKSDVEMIQEVIDAEVSPFIVPILVGATSQLEKKTLPDGKETPETATGLLFRNKSHMLVTCKHVWDYWRTANNGSPGAIVAFPGNGYTGVEVQPSAMFQDDEADIAAVRFPPSQITDKQKNYYPLDLLGVAEAKVGETLVAVGYPGMWRESGENKSKMCYSLLPFNVTGVSARSFVAEERANAEVLEDLDGIAEKAGRRNDARGGLSGAPVRLFQNSDLLRDFN